MSILWVGSVLPMTASPYTKNSPRPRRGRGWGWGWGGSHTGTHTRQGLYFFDRLFEVERGGLQLDDLISGGNQGIQQPVPVGQSYRWRGTDHQHERACIGERAQGARGLPENPPGFPKLNVFIVEIVQKAGGDQDPGGIGFQGFGDALRNEGFELMHGKGPRDMDAVEQLLRWLVESRRNLRDQKGIEGVGRVDEDDVLPGG